MKRKKRERMRLGGRKSLVSLYAFFFFSQGIISSENIVYSLRSDKSIDDSSMREFIEENQGEGNRQGQDLNTINSSTTILEFPKVFTIAPSTFPPQHSYKFFSHTSTIKRSPNGGPGYRLTGKESKHRLERRPSTSGGKDPRKRKYWVEESDDDDNDDDADDCIKYDGNKCVQYNDDDNIENTFVVRRSNDNDDDEEDDDTGSTTKQKKETFHNSHTFCSYLDENVQKSTKCRQFHYNYENSIIRHDNNMDTPYYHLRGKNSEWKTVDPTNISTDRSLLFGRVRRFYERILPDDSVIEECLRFLLFSGKLGREQSADDQKKNNDNDIKKVEVLSAKMQKIHIYDDTGDNTPEVTYSHYEIKYRSNSNKIEESFLQPLVGIWVFLDFRVVDNNENEMNKERSENNVSSQSGLEEEHTDEIKSNDDYIIQAKISLDHLNNMNLLAYTYKRVSHNKTLDERKKNSQSRLIEKEYACNRSTAKLSKTNDHRNDLKNKHKNEKEKKNSKEEEKKYGRIKSYNPRNYLPNSFRILSYNVWNTNPPSWVGNNGDPRIRWQKYSQRILYLAETISQYQPDIIGLQEVRRDDKFGPPGFTPQITHITEAFKYLKRLQKETEEEKQERKGEEQEKQQEERNAAKEKPIIIDDYPFFVYQPAMSFHSKEAQGIGYADEEGLAILSKHPIISHDYLLLPRDHSDTLYDGHQRICLHALIHIPPPVDITVDVYVTHWSLSERARDLAAIAISKYISAHAAENKGMLQILVGDLNAEPNENSLKDLTGRHHFVDSHLLHYPEPNPDLALFDRQTESLLTFPSCNATKRIDYILYYNKSSSASGESSSSSVSCTSCKSKDTPLYQDHQDHQDKQQKQQKQTYYVSIPHFQVIGHKYINQDNFDFYQNVLQNKEHPELGMLDPHSPTWPSDHRGIFADFQLKYENEDDTDEKGKNFKNILRDKAGGINNNINSRGEL